MVKDPGQGHSSNGHHPVKQKKSSKEPRPTYTTLSPDFGFIPQGRPLPFTEAIRLLPRRYRFVLTKPGFEPFLAESGLGEWKIVWFQLLLYAIVAALCGFIHMLLYAAQSGSSLGDGGLNNPQILRALSISSSFGLLLLIPFLFFSSMGLLYRLTRRFGGHGTFIQQAYTTLLFLTPCGLFVSLLGLIPFAGSFLSTFLGVVLFVYCIGLQCFATVAVHQMNGSKATGSVIITVLFMVPATLLFLVLWTFLFIVL